MKRQVSTYLGLLQAQKKKLGVPVFVPAKRGVTRKGVEGVLSWYGIKVLSLFSPTGRVSYIYCLPIMGSEYTLTTLVLPRKNQYPAMATCGRLATGAGLYNLYTINIYSESTVIAYMSEVPQYRHRYPSSQTLPNYHYTAMLIL